MKKNFKRILKSCLQGARCTKPADPARAKQEAQIVYDAFQKGGFMGSDAVPTFMSTLCIRSPEHLHLVFDEYFNIAGHDIEKGVEKQLSGDTLKAFLTVIRTIKDPRKMWADTL